MFLATIPPPEMIRQKAAEVVARPEYQLEMGLNDATEALWITIVSWILKPIVWLFEAMEGLPIFLRVFVIIILLVVAVALSIHIIWTLIASIRQREGRGLQEYSPRDQPANPEDLEAAAQSAEEVGQHLEAIRLLFRAALLRIERSEDKRLRIGLTNRELMRRYSRSPLGDPLQLFVETIDRKWYGGEICDFADYERCRDGHGRIRSLTQKGAHALGT